MKVRVMKWQINYALSDYDNFASQFVNQLFSPSVEERIKAAMENHRRMRMQTETNPAYQLPIIYNFRPEFNHVEMTLDLSNALVLDEFA